MPIYDIFTDKSGLKKVPYSLAEENLHREVPPLPESEEKTTLRDRAFSFIAARLFFLLLFVADLIWACCSLIIFAAHLAINLISAFKIPLFTNRFQKAALSVRRSLVCGLALLVALFSPSFGIMVACTYFLMYDKAGIEEVVPASLQGQFKEVFRGEGAL